MHKWDDFKDVKCILDLVCDDVLFIHVYLCVFMHRYVCLCICVYVYMCMYKYTVIIYSICTCISDIVLDCVHHFQDL